MHVIWLSLHESRNRNLCLISYDDGSWKQHPEPVLRMIRQLVFIHTLFFSVTLGCGSNDTKIVKKSDKSSDLSWLILSFECNDDPINAAESVITEREKDRRHRSRHSRPKFCRPISAKPNSRLERFLRGGLLRAQKKKNDAWRIPRALLCQNTWHLNPPLKLMPYEKMKILETLNSGITRPGYARGHTHDYITVRTFDRLRLVSPRDGVRASSLNANFRIEKVENAPNTSRDCKREWKDHLGLPHAVKFPVIIKMGGSI